MATSHSTFAAKDNLNAESFEECLAAPQPTGKGARISRPISSSVQRVFVRSNLIPLP